ncbi:MAG TPA: DUF3105 domain-containing protein [Thermoleophilaceae bacterium]|nr:DUF3105 domain-containing protein [Thermoleophilaceae bacterium]
MSHRRDQKERLRREREERERQKRDAEKRKKMLGYGLGGALAVAALVVVVLLATGGGGGSDAAAAEVFPEGGSFPEQTQFETQPAAEAAGCRLRSVKGSGSADHTTSLDERVKYNTNPPTTGRHYEIPAEDGIYGDAPPDEALVHGLEHGRVIIWVKPSLPEEQRADIRALVDDDSYQMFLVPRRNMPYAVAATAWNADPAPGGTGRMLLCDEVNDKTFDALAAFRDEHRSQGPEPIP